MWKLYKVLKELYNTRVIEMLNFVKYNNHLNQLGYEKIFLLQKCNYPI